MMLAPQERFARLRLARSDNIGPATFRRLLERFGSAACALEALPDLAARGGGRPVRLAGTAMIEAEIERVATLSARHVFAGDYDYPALLAETESAPPVLIVRGQEALFERPAIAMVGARNASASACRYARQMAHALADQGFAVISGLARGIDTAVHAGALEGGTIAVVAGGIDIFYPPENEALQRSIADQGLLISEMPPGVEPRARHFPRRNRIIAGLALGTLVVEAAPRSGSLITARLAGEAGREVMAIPGSPLDPRSRGCNQLIREGAVLVQDAADIIELVTPFAGAVRERPHKLQAELALAAPAALPVEAGDGERTRFQELLGMNFVSVDELTRQAGVSPAMAQTLLLELELAGRLERGAGAKVRLIS